MSALRILVALLALDLMVSSPGFVRAGDAPPAPPPPAPAAPPAPAGAQTGAQPAEGTPARVSYINGEVSFWRPGAQDWAPATLNTPLAPGDILYTGPSGNVEIQAGPRAFVRGAEGTQIGLDNHEPDFVQFRVTAGHAALDLRELAPGNTVELDTPNAAFTIERAGYYHVDVTQDSTTFTTHRGGTATATPAGGTATPIPANQQFVVTGTASPSVTTGAAPALTAWDRWNYQRTDYLVQPANTRYVAPAVYGAEALNQYGSWRPAESYGTVWVPAGVPAGWAPYSTGRWIWDPRFGWTWLDTAPWGWAPYHYGRWVFIGDYWAWAPGPIVVQPVYAPALVVFLGGGVAVGVAHPLCWAPLGWGEPVIPWWGGPGYVGVASWGGWGGPRVVNNVVVNQTTIVNVTNITVYKNVHVTNAVMGVPADRFGQGQVQPTRISQAQVQQLTPVRGALQVKPVAASMMPASGPAVKPPAAIQARAVVATRPPHDSTPALREHGLATTPAGVPAAAPRLVPAPKRVATPSNAVGAPGAAPGRGPSAVPGPAGPPAPGQAQRKDSRPAANAERSQQPAPPPGRPAHEAPPAGRSTPPPVPGQRPARVEPPVPSPGRPAQEATTPRHTPPPPAPPSTAQDGASQRGREKAQPVLPPASRSTPSPVPGQRPARVEPPVRVEGPEHSAPPRRTEHPEQREER